MKKAAFKLDRRKLDTDQVVRQLQASAFVAEKFVPQDEIKFRPIAASGGTTKHERNKLKNKANTIRFHKQKEHVRLIKCGKPLTKVVG